MTDEKPARIPAWVWAEYLGFVTYWTDHAQSYRHDDDSEQVRSELDVGRSIVFNPDCGSIWLAI